MHRYLWVPRSIATRIAPNGEKLAASVWFTYLAILDMAGTNATGNRGLLSLSLGRLSTHIGASRATARRHRDTLVRVGLIEQIQGQRYRAYIAKADERLQVPAAFLWESSSIDSPPRWGRDTTVALRTVIALMHLADWPAKGDPRRGVYFTSCKPNQTHARSGAMSHTEFKRGLALLAGEKAPARKVGWKGRTNTVWFTAHSRYDGDSRGSLPSLKRLDWSAFPAQELHPSATGSSSGRPPGCAASGLLTDTSSPDTSSPDLAPPLKVTSPARATGPASGEEEQGWIAEATTTGDRHFVEALNAENWHRAGGTAEGLSFEAWEGIVVGCIRHVRESNRLPMDERTTVRVRDCLKVLYANGWRPASVAALLTEKTNTTGGEIRNLPAFIKARIRELPEIPVQHVLDRDYTVAEQDARIHRCPPRQASDPDAALAFQRSRRDPSSFSHIP